MHLMPGFGKRGGTGRAGSPALNPCGELGPNVATLLRPLLEAGRR